MILFLDDNKYRLAKTIDFSEMQNAIVFNDENNSIELSDEKVVLKDFFDEEYKEDPINAMLDCISDEVVLTGLSEDQQNVLPRGSALYELYDSIYYSL